MSRQLETQHHAGHQPSQARPPNRTSLEQKLELLERRFTQPLDTTQSPFANNSTATNMNPFASPHGEINNNQTNPSSSQHSFAFDTPSLSATAYPHSHHSASTAAVTHKKNNSDNNGGEEPNAAAAGKSGEAVASDGLQAVQQATEKHMQRLAHQQNQHHAASSSRSNDEENSQTIVVVASSDASCGNHEELTRSNGGGSSSCSRSTLVAGNKTNHHRNSIRTASRQTRLSPIQKDENEASSQKDASKHAKKRKSVPAKISIPSVKESNHQQTENTSSKGQPNKKEDGGIRKRARVSTEAAATTPPMFLQQSSKQSSKGGPTATAPTTQSPMAPAAAAAAAAASTMEHSNGGGSSSRSSTTSKSAAASSKSSKHRRGGSKSAGAASKGGPETAASSTASREAPESASKSKKAAATKKPAHNALICDYFLSTSSSRNKKTSGGTATQQADATGAAAEASTTTARRKLEGGSKDDSSAAAKSPKRSSASKKASSSTPRKKKQQTRPTPKSDNNQSKVLVEELQHRVKELEDVCKDKEEQLKAVANNRTILHTALKSALNQREKELDDLTKAKNDWESRARLSMETLVRSEAMQEAKDLQERLTTDGARLGRIVQSRSNSSSTTSGRSGGMMMRGYVETWEEGYAARNLQTKRQELRDRKAAVEQRYAEAQKAAQRWKTEEADKQVKQTTDNESSPTEEGKDEEIIVGGVPIHSLLDVREQLESCRYHLQNISREEKELAAEDQKLNDEKGAHVRMLKRVASEEASRFRSRPKLHDRYVLKRLLGKGGFSEVWRAYDLVDLCEVAVKIHQLDPRWSDSKKENYTKHVSREYEIHRSVRHPRIVSLLDVFEIDNHSFATVLECCDGTDLDTLLKRMRRLPERDARAILLQILSGMQYLSQPSADGSRQGIIHYDLKPGNILFDTMGDAKITDFGLSKIVDAGDAGDSMELTSQGAGTYWYLPPECFMMEENPRISNKVDVWSIGVIFYQMLFGKRPFGDGQSQDKILSDRTILNAHEVRFPEKPQVSEECKEFIKTCLSYDQAFRPTIAQLCENPYVLTKEL